MYENYEQDKLHWRAYFVRKKRGLTHRAKADEGLLRRCIMRISATSILITLLFSQLWATGVAQVVSLKGDNVSIRQVFKDINRQTGYHYLWSAQDVQPNALVSVNIDRKPLTEALPKILNKFNLTYEIQKKTIVIKERANPTSPSANTALNNTNNLSLQDIRGRFVDVNGQPVSGASIRIKGTNIGTITDENGYFKINQQAISGQVLVCSSVGYEPIEIAAATEIGTIVLQQTNNTIEGVELIVNTGYQKISKERAAGSFAQVNAQDMEGRLQTNFLDRTEGLLPGMNLNLNRSSSNPQNNRNTIGIEVRGRSTLNAQAAPLIVVDGMPYEGDLTAINPNDVETMTVLKDASAASIYGVRSSNGVIVITTKMGKEGPAQINYTNTLAFRGLPSREYLNQMSSAELVDFQKEMFNYRSGDYASIDPRRAMNDVYRTLYEFKGGKIDAVELERQLDVFRNRSRYDQMDEFLNQVKVDQQHNLSLSGGTERYKYYYSVNYNRPGDYNKGRPVVESIGFNIRNSVKLTDWMNLNLNVLGKNQKQKGGIGFNFYDNYMGGKASYFLLRNEDGTPAQWYSSKSQFEIDRLNGLGLEDETYIPINEVDKTKVDFYNKYINLNFGANFKLMQGLTLDLSYQTERTEGYNGTTYSKDAQSVVAQINDATQIDKDGVIKRNVPQGGQFAERREDNNSYTLRAQLNFDRVLQNNDEISFIAGAERRQINSRFTDIYKYGYDESSLVYKGINEELFGINIRNTEAIFNSYTLSKRERGFTDVLDRFVSFYANGSYTYGRKLTLSGSIRVDQSNLFGTDIKNQYKPLWSLGALYKLPTFDQEWLNRLAVRLTYGVNGNVPKENGPYLISRVSSNLNYYTGELQANITTPPNPSLRWERTDVLNFGLDFAVLANRINGSIDIYNKKTADLLGPTAVDPTLGWDIVNLNYGNMKNRGIELGLNGKAIDRTNFKWNTTLNFSYNKNEITHLYVQQNTPVYYYNAPQNRVGKPVGSLYSIDYAGLDEKGEPLARKADGTLVKSTQQLEVADLIYEGTSVPPYSVAWRNGFRYKSFDLNFMFVFNGGHVMRTVHPEALSKYAELNYNSNFDRLWLNYWKKPGDEANPDLAPAFISGASGNVTDIYNAATKFVERADYIKLRDISLSYTLPQQILGRTPIRHVRITGQILNAWRWAANSHNLDPEVWNGYGLAPARGVLAPVTYNFGLSIGI